MPLGETGEICISGPQVMKGYWNRPDETAKVMTEDGAFRTGDIGFMTPEGYVKIVDRKKDMILVSGFNVYPNEVEDVVAMMPGVREVCAVASPNEHSGEVVRVVIVRKDPSLTREQVIEHCREAPDRLQGAEDRGVLERIAEDQRRQGAAPRSEERPARGLAGRRGAGFRPPARTPDRTPAARPGCAPRPSPAARGRPPGAGRIAPPSRGYPCSARRA